MLRGEGYQVKQEGALAAWKGVRADGNLTTRQYMPGYARQWGFWLRGGVRSWFEMAIISYTCCRLLLIVLFTL